ncbi:MAG: sulfatase-like hydrolase/transferase [Bacteroidota bacterium]
MKKSKCIRAILVVAVVLMGCMSGEKKEIQEPGNRPNFLFIFTDDQTNESINAINNKEVSTPNLDKLANSGVVFTHCFNQGSWGGAVCIASRAMLITGQYMYSARERVAHDPLWVEGFTKAGYETFLTGKWHNKDETALKSFKYAEAIGGGMYESMHPTEKWHPAYGRPTATNNSWKPWDPLFTGHWTPKVKDIVYDENGEKKISEKYQIPQHTSELYADRAINFLQTRVKDSDNPFFMYVAFNAPHDPRQSPKEFVDMYPPENVAVPKNFVEQHSFDQGDRRVRDENLASHPRTVDQLKVQRGEYYAIISHADQQIGRILKALEESGKADNTYIIFSSDHGLAMGKHGLYGKQNQYDHSVRMPLIIAGPGLEGGRIEDALVYLPCIFPTTYDIAGLDTPETVDFMSLNDILQGKDTEGYDAIFGTYRNFQRMVRTQKHKLIVYPHNGVQQLFDMEKDPEEMHNRIDDPDYGPIKAELYKKLQELQKETGDTLKLAFH